MIIQRKIDYDVPSGQFIYWEDIKFDGNDVTPLAEIINHLADRDDYVGTEYRIIRSGEHLKAVVTQPPLPKKEVKWVSK